MLELVPADHMAPFVRETVREQLGLSAIFAAYDAVAVSVPQFSSTSIPARHFPESGQEVVTVSATDAPAAAARVELGVCESVGLATGIAIPARHEGLSRKLLLRGGR